MLEKAVPADISELTRLYRACAESEYCLWDDEYPSCENARQDMGNIYVFRDNKKIAAAASMGELGDFDMTDWIGEGRYCELARICVAPDYQRRGLASQLVNALKLEAHRRGYRWIGLCVGVEQLAAQRLYASAGGEMRLKFRCEWGEYYGMRISSASPSE